MEVARNEPCERASGGRALQWECESDASVCVTVYVETASVHQKLKGSILKIRTRGGGSGLP